jgi:TetR/AcrR family transcriptional regulator, transcriptional repressor for nem operon
METPSARTRILDAAERLCQTRGFNAFSFRDLAGIVGIRSASIHYHFKTKADLGKALIIRYRHALETVMGDIERRETRSLKRIRRFAGVLRSLLRDENRMCLCGILAAEAGTISDDMKAELRRFFEGCEAWLARELLAGRRAGELSFVGTPAAAACTMLSTLEGAMMTSRAFGNDRPLRDSAQWLLRQLAAG